MKYKLLKGAQKDIKDEAVWQSMLGLHPKDHPDWFEEVKDEFKVGQWVIGIDAGHQPSGHQVGKLYRIMKIIIHPVKNKSYFLSDEDEEEYGVWLDSVRLATKQEIESHLIAEAERRGFYVIGNKFISPDDNNATRPIIPYHEYEKVVTYYYDIKNDVLRSRNGLKTFSSYFSNPAIYEAGKWAEIVKEEPFKINGYEMKQNGDLIEFGCAKFSKYQLIALLDCLKKCNDSTVNNKLNLNRKIKSIILDSGVLITIEEIQKIVDLCTEAK